LGDLIYRIKFLCFLLRSSFKYCKIADGKITLKDRLFDINNLRKLLEHYSEENEPDLIKNTLRLLGYIAEIMGHPFFNILLT